MITTFNTNTHYKRHKPLKTYTNYRKANWEDFTKEIEQTLSRTPLPTDKHQGNKILTKATLTADRHNILYGKIRNKHKFLPENTRAAIDTRNTARKQNPTDPQLTPLKNNINKMMQ